MITVEKYLPFHEFQIHPSPEDRRAAEEQALEALVDAFAAEMKAKLKAKADEGWRGWDDPQYKGNIERFLLDHAQRGLDDSRQYVDVANLAAMLWNFGRDES